MNFLSKLRGDSAALPPRAPARAVILAFAGGVLTLGGLAALTEGLGLLLVLGSFGATCVLVFGFPDAPFSQPRNIILGHLLSTLIGLGFTHALGPNSWSVGLATGAAIAAMMLTRTVHPPAGSNPVIVYLTQPGWSFALFPTLAGAVLIVLVALIYQNATRSSRWPKYW